MTFEENIDILLRNAEDDGVKEIIQLFSPDETRSTNLKRFNARGVQKQALEATINFLNSIKGNYPSATQRLRETSVNKLDLARDIVEWLTELIPQTCPICSVIYTSAEFGDDENYLSCFICNRKSHVECYKEHPTDVSIGIVYLCTSCTQQKASPVAAKDEGSKETLEESDEKKSGNSEEGGPKDEPTDDDKDNKPICPKYKHGRCDNYETCKLTFNHPRRCRNMLSLGKCRFGNSCRYFHPKICYKSMNDRKCTDLECRFFHLKYTKRYEESLDNQLNNQNVPQYTHDQSNHNQHHSNHERHRPQSTQESFLSEQFMQTNSSIKELARLIHRLISNREEPVNHHVQEQAYQYTQPASQPQVYHQARQERPY